MDEDLRLLLPRDKHDTTSAAALVALGWNKVEQAMPEILEWLQDVNWPVVPIFVPFFVDAGVRLAPFIRPIFAADDAMWTFNILQAVVSQSPELASELSGELERLAYSPTAAERLEGLFFVGKKGDCLKVIVKGESPDEYRVDAIICECDVIRQ